MKAGAIIPAEKTCKCCHLLLPITKFDKKPSNPDGYRHKCRSCAYPAKAASHKRWVEKNRKHLADYNKRRLDAERANRPAKTCQCGNAHDFRWYQDHWVCVPCATAVSKASKARRSLERCRRIGAKAKFQRLKSRHGPEMAEAFQKLLMEGSPFPILMWKIVRRALPPWLHKESEQVIERIYKLNRLQCKPAWNMGWTCTSCQIENNDDRFFDLDHVVPRCRNGAPGSGNLQVLCPSCHRLKTISDLHRQRKADAAACTQGEATSALTGGRSPPVNITLTGEPEQSGQNGCLFRDDPVNGNRAVSVAA